MVHLSTSNLVEGMHAIEGAERLDGPAVLLSKLAGAVTSPPAWRDFLRGRPVGHAIHPILTDLPLGFWTSATVLDWIRPEDRRSSRLLVGLGVAASVPAAVTGLAEWDQTEGGDRRVGVVHAACNTVALALYTASYLTRRGDRHRSGALLALGAGLAAGAGGYLGGHLISARKVASAHPALAQPTG
jgi:uncharacterized membrane protein